MQRLEVSGALRPLYGVVRLQRVKTYFRNGKNFGRVRIKSQKTPVSFIMPVRLSVHMCELSNR